MDKNKSLIGLLFFACLVMLLFPACGSDSGSDKEGLKAHTAPPLERGSFSRELLLTGELQAVRSIEVKAPQTSIFQMRIQFMAEEGSRVEPGDPLLDFDNSALATQARALETQILDAETQIIARENQLASALKDLEIELEQKQYAHDRAKLDISIDPEIVSEKEWADRQLAYTQAAKELQETKARVELTQKRGLADLDVLKINRDKLRKDLLLAQDELGRLSVKAPASGLVVYETRQRSTLKYQEGDQCWPGQKVISLPDLSEMRVVFDVNEVDAPALAEGMPVQVMLDAFPNRSLSGVIERIPSMAVKRDEESKIAVFKVWGSLEETWVGEMKPGMSVLGKIQFESENEVPLVRREWVRLADGRYWLERDGKDPIEIFPIDRNATHYRIEENAWAELQGAGIQVAVNQKDAS